MNDDRHPESLISLRDAAKLLNCSPGQLRRLAITGAVPSLRIGSLLRFRASLLIPNDTAVPVTAAPIRPRNRYQNGSVELKARKKGPAVWVFRYYEAGLRKSKEIGTVDAYPTK